MRSVLLRAICFLVLVAAVVFVAAAGQTQSPRPNLEFKTDTVKIRVVTVADGLESPWAMEFLPGGDILVTERPGRLRRISGGKLQEEPISGVPAVQFLNHAGLMDVELHPNFATNNLLYLAYTKTGERGGTTAVLRARLEGNRLVDSRDIFVADAWIASGLNPGGRLAFDRSGMLYASIGDRGPTTEPLSQDLTKHNGKIVRLYDDGRIPDDNPFVGRQDAKPDIYSYGHRNPQGMTMNPDTGEIWASEHGPMGGDEVNIVKKGANYGWPVVSYGRKYSGEIISEQPWREGMESPRYFWVPSIGISGVLLYTGDRFPTWKGNMFVTGMSGRMIQRVRIGGRGQNERELILNAMRQEVRDVRQGPDGLIYLVTRQDAERTAKSGMVLRLEPVE